MTEKTIAPYGSWGSPITAALIAQGGRELSEPRFVDGALYWLESRPTEGGRYVLRRRGVDGQIEDVTPEGTNVRTRVHEYGGGAYVVQRGAAIFSEWSDQRLYRQDRGDDPAPITPEPELPAGVRYADARVTPDGQTLVCVRERHTASGQAAEVVNELVTLPATGGAAQVVASGRDFYASPRVSPDGQRVAWLEWDHPNMPWDGCELYVADLAPDGVATSPRLIAGGTTESIYQPEWSPEGVLHFASDRSGWWNLYRWETDRAVALAPIEAEVGSPQWTFGQTQYAFLAGGRIACIVVERGVSQLGLIEPDSGAIRWLASPFNAIFEIVSDGNERLALVAGGPHLSYALALYDVATGGFEIVRRSSDVEVDPSYLATAEPIEFPTGNGLTAHGFFYAPANRDYAGPSDELPPLVVYSHGGPTGMASPELHFSHQFWTSRGIAVVDVNYGGSAGYGRAYRERLKGNWGIVDIEDCVNAARWLAAQGRVDGRRMAIRGGSAGGYTTLAALTFTDVFGAGASYFGISDLETLARDTHKFESRYLDGLVGPYPAARETYHERSPIHFTDELSAPMIIFQGLEDKVVPPAQAEEMVAALARKGLSYAYVPFEGEQHGFRRAENIQRSLEAELYFYGRIFGFTPADAIEPVEIENL